MELRRTFNSYYSDQVNLDALSLLQNNNMRIQTK